MIKPQKAQDGSHIKSSKHKQIDSSSSSHKNLSTIAALQSPDHHHPLLYQENEDEGPKHRSSIKPDPRDKHSPIIFIPNHDIKRKLTNIQNKQKMTRKSRRIHISNQILQKFLVSNEIKNKTEFSGRNKVEHDVHNLPKIARLSEHTDIERLHNLLHKHSFPKTENQSTENRLNLGSRTAMFNLVANVNKSDINDEKKRDGKPKSESEGGVNGHLMTFLLKHDSTKTISHLSKVDGLDMADDALKPDLHHDEVERFLVKTKQDIDSFDMKDDASRNVSTQVADKKKDAKKSDDDISDTERALIKEDLSSSDIPFEQLERSLKYTHFKNNSKVAEKIKKEVDEHKKGQSLVHNAQNESKDTMNQHASANIDSKNISKTLNHLESNFITKQPKKERKYSMKTADSKLSFFEDNPMITRPSKLTSMTSPFSNANDDKASNFIKHEQKTEDGKLHGILGRVQTITEKINSISPQFISKQQDTKYFGKKGSIAEKAVAKSFFNDTDLEDPRDSTKARATWKSSLLDAIPSLFDSQKRSSPEKANPTQNSRPTDKKKIRKSEMLDTLSKILNNSLDTLKFTEAYRKKHNCTYEVNEDENLEKELSSHAKMLFHGCPDANTEVMTNVLDEDNDNTKRVLDKTTPHVLTIDNIPEFDDTLLDGHSPSVKINSMFNMPLISPETGLPIDSPITKTMTQDNFDTSKFLNITTAVPDAPSALYNLPPALPPAALPPALSMSVPPDPVTLFNAQPVKPIMVSDGGALVQLNSQPESTPPQVPVKPNQDIATLKNDEQVLSSAIEKYKTALTTISGLLAKYNANSQTPNSPSNVDTRTHNDNMDNPSLSTKDSSKFNTAFTDYKSGMNTISNVMSSYAQPAPKQQTVQHSKPNAQFTDEITHFNNAYNKYKNGLHSLSDIIDKYTNKMLYLDSAYENHVKPPESVKKEASELTTQLNAALNGGVLSGGSASTNSNSESMVPPNIFDTAYPEIKSPVETAASADPYSNSFQASTKSKGTGGGESVESVKSLQKQTVSLKDELKSISSILDKFTSYQKVPKASASTNNPIGRQYINSAYPIYEQSALAARRHLELAVPNWANPLNKSEPPGSFKEQYKDNMKYLKLLQNDMQSSVDKFNQDILNEQPMNTSQVNQTKTYPLELPEEELERINHDKTNGIDLSRYYVNLNEVARLMGNSTVPQSPVEYNGNNNQLLHNNTATSIDDNQRTTNNSGGNESGIDVTHVQYFNNNGENQPSKTTNDSNIGTENESRHLDGNVNVKGNMDHLKSLMAQMQQDIDKSNEALQKQNQEKLEEKIEEDKKRKEDDAKQAEAEGLEEDSEQRHSFSFNFNATKDKYNNNFGNNNNNGSKSTTFDSPATFPPEEYDKNEKNKEYTEDKIAFDTAQQLVQQMQVDAFNTNAAIYALQQGQGKKTPADIEQKVKDDAKKQYDIINKNKNKLNKNT